MQTDSTAGIADEGSWAGVGDDEDRLDTGTPDTGPTRSTIKFPYVDLKEAARVCGVIKNKLGSQCDSDEVAAALGQTPKSGAFRTRIAAGVAFGLWTTRRGRVTLTDRGHAVAGGNKAAVVDAFLSIELYKVLYERYRGNLLPADPGLTAELQSLGVLSSQSDRARQVMQRSAGFAGFFHAGRDRLVKPPAGSMDESVEKQKDAVREETPGGTGMADSPLLQGLWGMLPNSGEFPAEKRAQWFKALAVNLDLVYGDGHLDVQVKPTPPASRAASAPA